MLMEIQTRATKPVRDVNLFLMPFFWLKLPQTTMNIWQKHTTTIEYFCFCYSLPVKLLRIVKSCPFYSTICHPRHTPNCFGTFAFLSYFQRPQIIQMAEETILTEHWPKEFHSLYHYDRLTTHYHFAFTLFHLPPRKLCLWSSCGY